MIYSRIQMTQSRVRGRGRGRGRARGHGRTRRGRSSSSSSLSYSELGLAGSLVGASALSQGSELDLHEESSSLSSFIGGGRRKPGCANDIANHILCFLELLNTIKIYHWSTLSYPTHKATDELHDKLSALVDSFIEIYIGHCARRGGAAGAGVPVFRFKSGRPTSIEFCECKSPDAFCKVLDDNIVHMEGLGKSLDGYTDLVNIRDEMVGALAQALYLLRLK
jgi:hypothetical protein